MFTGLVETLGRVESIVTAAGGARLQLRPEHPLADLRTGESVAISGVCLSAEPESRPDRLTFFCSAETLSRTTLGDLRPGAGVNLERALRPTDRLGGHLVLGHVDAVGEIRRWERRGEAWELAVRFPPELAPLIAPKGSIAVDGISLTVVALEGDAFTVAVIPITAQVTALRDAAPGRRVNLEADVLARYALRAIEALGAAAPPPAGLSLDTLRRAGF